MCPITMKIDLRLPHRQAIFAEIPPNAGGMMPKYQLRGRDMHRALGLACVVLVGFFTSSPVGAWAAAPKTPSSVDPDESRFDDPRLGRYMLRSSVLIGLGLKHGWGSDGWGRTEYAKAFHIKSDEDYLHNPAAQDGAAETLIAYQVEAMAPLLKRYDGRTFKTADGKTATINQSALIGAAHRVGVHCVIAYFQTYDAHDTVGKADQMPSRFRQVEVRLVDFKDTPYNQDGADQKTGKKK